METKKISVLSPERKLILEKLINLWALRPNLHFCTLLDFVLCLDPTEAFDLSKIKDDELLEKLNNQEEMFEQ